MASVSETRWYKKTTTIKVFSRLFSFYKCTCSFNTLYSIWYCWIFIEKQSACSGKFGDSWHELKRPPVTWTLPKWNLLWLDSHSVDLPLSSSEVAGLRKLGGLQLHAQTLHMKFVRILICSSSFTCNPEVTWGSEVDVVGKLTALSVYFALKHQLKIVII